MKADITSRTDVETLVDRFYEYVKSNATIGYIFNDVAQTNWEHHLPKMYNFWSSILLGDQSFQGNPMQRHVDLSKQTPLAAEEFEAWITLFRATVDELFQGPKAEEAKERAENIARIMLYKVSNS